jgi:hypothetical protein
MWLFEQRDRETVSNRPAGIKDSIPQNVDRDFVRKTLSGIIADPPSPQAQLDAIKQLRDLEGYGPVSEEVSRVSAADAQALRRRYMEIIRRKIPLTGLHISIITHRSEFKNPFQSLGDFMTWIKDCRIDDAGVFIEPDAKNDKEAEPATNEATT